MISSFFNHITIRKGFYRRAGFTLLLAALVSSIALSLGASIYAIAHKEITLSSISRDSQFAFYAADTAAECALYWDIRYDYFATSTPPGVTPTCDGMNPAPTITPPSATYPYTQSFQLSLFAPDRDYCAEVAVTKSIDAVTGALKTQIHADGYSVACDAILTSSRALQRSVELNY